MLLLITLSPAPFPFKGKGKKAVIKMGFAPLDAPRSVAHPPLVILSGAKNPYPDAGLTDSSVASLPQNDR